MAQSHYSDSQPEVRSRRRCVKLDLPDLSVELQTDRGVFSAERVDLGTLVLLKAIPAPPATGNLLDLGCGYGPIAITVAKRSPGASVWAVDVNERALGLLTANADEIGASNIKTALPDAVDGELQFDAIYSNPPIRIGKAALHELCLQWLARLAPQGRAWFVVQKYLGSDSMAKWLNEQGFATKRLQSSQGYRVLEISPRRIPPG